MEERSQLADAVPDEKASILIVDDQPENLELLVQILDGEGYHARPALNAQVALGAVGFTHPELILLDIRMPEMDGFELCRKLKSDPTAHDIPIIFISAIEDIEEKIKAFQVGGVDYITRPFQKEEVLARVHTHLELSRMRRQMEALVNDRTRKLQIKTEELAKEISTRRIAMEKLKESKENYRFLVENQNDLVVQFDAAHRLIFANPNYCRVFGKSVDDILGQPFKSPIHKEDREKTEKALKELTRPPFAIHHQERALTVDGWRWFEWSARANVDEKGEIRSIISVGRDITEKTETEEKLRHAHKMEAIGTLSGGIAHDFNNMLSIIIGNTELAMDELSKRHPVQANLDEIKLASLRARDVVRQLVDLSHAADPQRRPLDIGAQIHNTLKLIRASLPASVEIEEKMPPIPQMVLADANQIQQLVINLSTNAFQAMENQGGTLTVAITPLDPDSAVHHLPDLPRGPYVVLSVSDTGHGINPNIKDKVFDPYFTTQEIGKGSGMGLAVANRIVKNHDGAIHLKTTEGRGSTFRVYLPITDQPAVTESTAEKGFIPTGSESILFIDDEPAIIKTAQSTLGRLGYAVTATNDPGEALQLFRSDANRYDLVITDMTMPKMNGVELSKAILKIKPRTPIIICTGHSDQIDADKALKIGIRHYADKPLVKQEIASLIRFALDNRNS